MGRHSKRSQERARATHPGGDVVEGEGWGWGDQPVLRPVSPAASQCYGPSVLAQGLDALLGVGMPREGESWWCQLGTGGAAGETSEPEERNKKRTIKNGRGTDRGTRVGDMPYPSSVASLGS